MRTAGIVLLILGLVMTLYTGFTYVTKEKVVDLGAIEITKDKEHRVYWEPYVGIGAMVVGGALLVFAKRRPGTA